MELQVSELERVRQQIQQLGRRDWVGWAIGLLSILVVGTGLVGLVFTAPQAVNGTLSLPVALLAAFLYAAASAAACFIVYALVRQREGTRVRVDLLLETFQNAVTRLQGMVDPVTRVYNRFCLEELLQKEMRRCDRYNKPLALIMADLDKFKQINDTYGHATGDLVLSEVGNILRSCVRGSDSVIRYGGDEFVMVLIETEEKGAQVVADRVRKKVQVWNETNKLARFELGVSTGISIYTGGKKAADLIAEADQLMYTMKQGRVRDRAVV